MTVGVNNPVTGTVPDYQVVAASSTTTALGATGAKGDYLSHVNIKPATVGAGSVTIFDGVVVVETFTSGTLTDLKPFPIVIGAFSKTGAWNITTGTNVSVTAYGSWT